MSAQGPRKKQVNFTRTGQHWMAILTESNTIPSPNTNPVSKFFGAIAGAIGGAIAGGIAGFIGGPSRGLSRGGVLGAIAGFLGFLTGPIMGAIRGLRDGGRAGWVLGITWFGETVKAVALGESNTKVSPERYPKSAKSNPELFASTTLEDAASVAPGAAASTADPLQTRASVSRSASLISAETQHRANAVHARASLSVPQQDELPPRSDNTAETPKPITPAAEQAMDDAAPLPSSYTETQGLPDPDQDQFFDSRKRSTPRPRGGSGDLDDS